MRTSPSARLASSTRTTRACHQRGVPNLLLHLGINLHISEIVSDLLHPVVTTYKGEKEIISTEDIVVKIEIKNIDNTGWSRSSYWRDMVVGEYRACDVCSGEEGYVWAEESLELCLCEDDRDGIDDTLVNLYLKVP